MFLHGVPICVPCYHADRARQKSTDQEGEKEAENKPPLSAGNG